MMRISKLLPTLFLGLLLGSSAQALILVTTADDELQVDGDCSLREALRSANFNESYDNCGLGAPGADDIIIPLVDTIILNSRLDIREAVTITGVNPRETTISGNGSTQIFDIDLASGSGDVVLENLGFENGRAATINGGGAFDVDCVSLLRIDNVHFRGNISAGTGSDNGPGGAIRMRPSGGCGARLEVVDSLFIGNESTRNAGGAIWLSNGSGGFTSVVIERSQFIDNRAGISGGALLAYDLPVLTVTDSLFEGNRTLPFLFPNSQGGAMYLSADSEGSALYFIENGSVVDNETGFAGGGIRARGPLVLSMRNVTMSGNVAEGGDGHAIALSDNLTAVGSFLTLVDNGQQLADEPTLSIRIGASLNLGHSIIGNAWPTDALCFVASGASYGSLGYLIDQGSSCAGEPTDLSNTNADLVGPIRRPATGVGFLMPVWLPSDSSPAVDVGPSVCPGPLSTTTTEDQLGRPRPVMTSRGAADCDAGAIERQAGDLSELFADRFED